MPQKLTFLHIPKTGGTTLREIVKRQYKTEQYQRVYPSFKVQTRIATLTQRLPSDDIRCVMGHFPFGIHRELDYPCQYLTMLRDPISHFLSDYNYASEVSKNRLHGFVMDDANTLDDYITYRFEEKRWDNQQTRYISGYHGIYEYASDDPETLPTLAPLPDEALAIAKANIDQHFVVVGTTERFDETLLLFQAILGWQNCYYQRENVTRTRTITRADLSDDQRERIAYHTRMDQALYAYAQQRLQTDLDQLGNAEQRLRRFQGINRIYGTAAQVYKSLPFIR